MVANSTKDQRNLYYMLQNYIGVLLPCCKEVEQQPPGGKEIVADQKQPQWTCYTQKHKIGYY